MKTLFICDDFTLDLTGKTLNWTEENSWFTDEPVLNSTFPFEIDFAELKFFLKFKNHNDFNPKTRWDGILQRADGRITPAYFILEEIGERAKGTIRDGLELFPSWNKKLSDIDMGTVDVPNMRIHAMSVINKGWPATTYNFPMIGAWSLYQNDPPFADFHGFYNKMNWEGTKFLDNLYFPELNYVMNQNIVYPMVYWLHILESGIQAAGYTLHGDIRTDPDFTRAIMPPAKLVVPELSDNIDLTTGFESVVLEDHPLYRYRQTFTLLENVKYRISGNFKYVNSYWEVFGSARIKFNGDTVYFIHQDFAPEALFSVDFKIESMVGGTLEIEADYLWLVSEPFQHGDIFTGTAFPTEVYDENGEPVIALADYNTVNLSENLPQITFGDFIKIIRKWKNYDFDLRDGKEVWMNLIEKEMNHKDAIDLRQHEVKYPLRKLEQQSGFLIKFSNEDEEYPLAETYVTLGGMQTDNFTKDENTKEILIDAIPYPVVHQADESDEPGPYLTAKILSDASDKVGLVLYEGLKDGHNWTLPIDSLTTPVVTSKYYFRFLQFRLKSIMYGWQIHGRRNEFSNLRKNSKIFAFNNYMIVKNLNREKSPDEEKIEVEAYTY